MNRLDLTRFAFIKNLLKNRYPQLAVFVLCWQASCSQFCLA